MESASCCCVIPIPLMIVALGLAVVRRGSLSSLTHAEEEPPPFSEDDRG